MPSRCFLLGRLVPLLCLALSGTASDGEVRLNEIQVIGTHNSYHVAPAPWVRSVAGSMAGRDVDWDYTHAPLPTQLERGVRSFELDLNNWRGEWRVFHAPIGDNQTTCLEFIACLESVKAWSDGRPNHVPISFLLEIKDDTVALDHHLSRPGPHDLDRMDADIRAVFPPDRIITPDAVRGDAPTLEEAVLTKGWPTLAEARGKVLFILHERGANRDLYTQGRPSLEGRVAFVNSEPGRPDAATLVMDGPHDEAIPERVRAGYLVRTRADAGLREGKTGSTARFERAKASGAHILSTDFPPGQAHEETGYVVAFEGGLPARCNPVNAPAHCEAAKLEP